MALPFSQRTTASVAVFACIFLASPQGAPMLPATNLQIAALALEYAQLTNLYPALIHQDVANQQTVLNAAVSQAVTFVTALVATLNSMTPGPIDQAIVLASYRIVATNALSQIKAVQSAQGDSE